jgi:Ala-tRNA(Pro) deacylase
MNDAGKKVMPVLDARLLACETVNCHPLSNDKLHPLSNDKTTSLSPDSLLRFIKNLGYAPVVVDFAKG